MRHNTTPMDNFTKMKNRGGINLPSREEAHIFRLPPSSIHTRKHEPVSEADVLWMTRPDAAGSDPTRINQGISYYPRGVNPSIEVEYQNRGAGSRTTSLHQNQVGSNYKIEVVRPPLFPVETLNSLSNPRTHQTHSVGINPGLPNGVAGGSLAYDYDMIETANAFNSGRASGPITVPATAYYRLDTPSVMSAKWAINENLPESYEVLTNPGRSIDVSDFVCRENTPYGVIIRPTNTAATTNPQLQGGVASNTDASAKVRKEILFQNIRPNFNIVVYDPGNHISTEVSASITQKNNIAVQAALGLPITLNRDDGTQIKLKDSLWTAVQTNVGVDSLILTIQDPEIELERNLPLYAVSSGMTLPADVTERRNQEYDLEGKLAVYAQPNMDLSAYYNQENTREIQGRTKLPKQVFNNSFDNQGSARPRTYERQLPALRDTSIRQEAGAQSFGRMFE